MNTERKPVDVLAVMDRAIRRDPDRCLRDFPLRETRAAVAELIEAAQAAVSRDGANVMGLGDVRAALARCGVQS